MGSRGMVVMDHSTQHGGHSPVLSWKFCRMKSCGKCGHCRAGPSSLPWGCCKKQPWAGDATAADLAQLEALCHMVKDTSLCGLGQSAPQAGP